MHIQFKTLKFKNILSYGNAISVYNFESGIDIISATNGAGKSTIIDALTYALFGKPYRKINLKGLINNKNNKELYTELLFDIDDIEYMIKRGMKPNIFEIYSKVDDEYKLINQDSTSRDYQNILENDILMLNETVFRQLIVLGANVSNSKNFMDLNATEKEEVFQVVTDTSLFNHLSILIKNKRNEIKTILTEHNYKFDILSSTIDSERQNLVKLQRQNAYLQQNKDQRILEIQKVIDDGESKLIEYDRAIQKLKDLKSQYDEKLLDLENQKAILKDKNNQINALNGKIVAFDHLKESSISCDNCSHEIISGDYDADLHDSMKKHVITLTDEINSLKEIYRNSSEIGDGMKEKLLNSNRIIKNRSELVNTIAQKRDELKEIDNWVLVDIDKSVLEHKEDELLTVKTILSDADSKHNALNQLMKIIGGDNLKGYILSKQIPLLNKYINSYIEKFSDFNFNFVIDNNFKEQFISRNETQEFHSFSNGQKQRFTFAILFAFLKLIEERSGVSTNLLAMDEILDSSADSVGRSELLDILYSNFSDKKNIIIISHQPEIKERMEIINRTFEVTNAGFSKLVEVKS
jgi:DNA repair exonuclease SbcCD ATPase subunit